MDFIALIGPGAVKLLYIFKTKTSVNFTTFNVRKRTYCIIIKKKKNYYVDVVKFIKITLNNFYKTERCV